MRPESNSTTEADNLEKSGPGYPGGNVVAESPAWEIIEAGTSRTFEKEFFEPVLSLLTNLIKRELSDMDRLLKKEKNNGSTR